MDRSIAASNILFLCELEHERSAIYARFLRRIQKE